MPVRSGSGGVVADGEALVEQAGGVAAERDDGLRAADARDPTDPAGHDVGQVLVAGDLDLDDQVVASVTE